MWSTNRSRFVTLVKMYFFTSCLLSLGLAVSVPLIKGQPDGDMNKIDANNTRNSQTSPPPTTTSTTTTTTTTVEPECPNFDWNITMSDIVIILDSSESLGETRFNEAKEFFRKLLQTTAVLRPEYTRVTVLTFAKEFEIRIDHISNYKAPQMRECEFLGLGGEWESNLMWKKDNGENLKAALLEAQTILRDGREQRNKTHVQRVWIASDFHDIKMDVQGVLDALKKNAEVYGVGLGNHLKDEEIERAKTYVTSPACFYDGIDSWKSKIAGYMRPNIKIDPTGGELVTYQKLDASYADDCAMYTCREFNANSSRPMCSDANSLEEDGDNEGDGGELNWKVLTAGVVMGGALLVLIVVGLVLLICHVKNRNGEDKPTPFPILHENISTNTSHSLRRSGLPSNQSSTRTDVATISAQGSTRTDVATISSQGSSSSGNIVQTPTTSLEPVYENDIVQEILREHSVTVSNPELSAPALPPRHQGSQQNPRPPPLPRPLTTTSFQSVATSQGKAPHYVQILDEPNFATFPSTSQPHDRRTSDLSSNYEHVMDYQRSQSQLVMNDKDYVCMKVAPPQKVTVESETQTTVASRMRKNFHNGVSRVFSRQPNSTSSGHSNTVANPKRLKAKPKKFQGKDETESKRKSAKFGTVRFKTLLSKFSKAETDENDVVQIECVCEQETAAAPAPQPQQPPMSRQSSYMDGVL